MPGALHLRLGANELSEPAMQSQTVKSNNPDLFTGQSGLTTGAFELKPDMPEPAKSASLDMHNQHRSMERYTQRAEQVGNLSG